MVAAARKPRRVAGDAEHAPLMMRGLRVAGASTGKTPVSSTSSVVSSYTDSYSYDPNSNRISETEDQGYTGSATDTITSTYPGAPGFCGLRDV